MFARHFSCLFNLKDTFHGPHRLNFVSRWHHQFYGNEQEKRAAERVFLISLLAENWSCCPKTADYFLLMNASNICLAFNFPAMELFAKPRQRCIQPDKLKGVLDFSESNLTRTWGNLNCLVKIKALRKQSDSFNFPFKVTIDGKLEATFIVVPNSCRGTSWPRLMSAADRHYNRHHFSRLLLLLQWIQIQSPKQGSVASICRFMPIVCVVGTPDARWIGSFFIIIRHLVLICNGFLESDLDGVVLLRK